MVVCVRRSGDAVTRVRFALNARRFRAEREGGGASSGGRFAADQPTRACPDKRGRCASAEDDGGASARVRRCTRAGSFRTSQASDA
ncbi:RNA polymerase subunit sigma [Burkholderia pseudomallei]|uniref:RNA polymerase subunit sigma n=1 Tax=Burkholderia pseudomallei TaxID=28450 RepID=UPI000978273D|nr:RNA polymerase subunit sigma [Burkholderia pseudomallei]ONC42403.1 RNA polymerase subunit sigma [Burkholderia pseudomallei]